MSYSLGNVQSITLNDDPADADKTNRLPLFRELNPV